MGGADPQLWNKNFEAKLPNIPGQVYTIGSKFPGLRENDEFIFCTFPLVKPSHCRISVDDKGNYWIHRLSVAAKTFVNNKELATKPVKLKIGDIVALGCRKQEFEGILQKGKFAVFEFKSSDTPIPPETYRYIGQEYDSSYHCDADGHYHFHEETPDNTTKGKALAKSVGESPAILHHILSKLLVSDLPPLRLVSSAWNTAISQIMIGSSTIYLSDNWEGYKGSNGIKFFRCVRDLKNLDITKLKLKLPYIGTLDKKNYSYELEQKTVEIGDGKPAGKFLQDLTRYLEGKHHFKSLSMKGRISSLDEFQLFDTTLQNLCKNLTHLNLSIFFAFTPSSQGNWKFLNLARLTTNEGFQSKEIMAKWAEKVVEKINPKSLKEFYSLDHRKSSFFLNEIASRRFPNLSTISLQNVPGKSLKLLLKCQSPITKLHLHRVRHVSVEENLLTLEQVLSKFAPSLSDLTLGIKWTKREVKFPLSFPSLESFKFLYSECCKVKFPPLKYINYSKTFPKLRRLSLKNLELHFNCERNQLGRHEYQLRSEGWVLSLWGENEDAWKTFFPVESGQICKTLTELNVYHLNPYFKPRRQGYLDKAKEFLDLFPNVDHRWAKIAKTFLLKTTLANGKDSSEEDEEDSDESDSQFRFYRKAYKIPTKMWCTPAPQNPDMESESDSSDNLENTGDFNDSDDLFVPVIRRVFSNAVPDPASEQSCSNDSVVFVDETISPNPVIADIDVETGSVAMSTKSAGPEKGKASDEWDNLWALVAPKVRKIAEKSPKSGSELQLKIHELVNRYENEHLFE